MGFLKRMAVKSLYKSVCKSFIKAYSITKSQSPGASEKDLIAATLAMRKPFWQEIEDKKFTFKNYEVFCVEDGDTLTDIVRYVLVVEFIIEIGIESRAELAGYVKDIIEVTNDEFGEMLSQEEKDVKTLTLIIFIEELVKNS